MNVGEIIAEIKRYGFGSGTGHTDDTIRALINTSQSEILSAATWPFAQKKVTINLSSNASSIAAPSDVSKVEAVYLLSVQNNQATNRKLIRLSPADFLELEANDLVDPVTAPSLYYSVFSSSLLGSNGDRNNEPGETIRILPKYNAAQTGTLWYSSQAPILSGSFDHPFIPVRYHYMLVDGALARLYGATDQPDQAKAAEERFSARLEQMKSDLLETNLDRFDALTSGYSVGSIIKEVRDHGFDRAGDSLIKLWINDVINELAGMDNWPWLEKGPVEITANANTPLITLPADCAKPMKVQFKDGDINLFRERQDLLLDKYGVDVLDEPGDPERYSMWGTDPSGVPQIRLFPIPQRNVTLNLWYLKVPTPLASVSDMPPFPVRHHRLLVLGVLLRACQMMGDEQSLSKLPIFKEEYDERLQRMRDDLMRPQIDNPDYMPMDGDPESSF
jgi:hypothetical protein